VLCDRPREKRRAHPESLPSLDCVQDRGPRESTTFFPWSIAPTRAARVPANGPRGAGLEVESFRYLGQYPSYFMFNGFLFLLATGTRRSSTVCRRSISCRDGFSSCCESPAGRLRHDGRTPGDGASGSGLAAVVLVATCLQTYGIATWRWPTTRCRRSWSWCAAHRRRAVLFRAGRSDSQAAEGHAGLERVPTQRDSTAAGE